MENRFFSYKPSTQSFPFEKPMYSDHRFQNQKGQTIHIVSSYLNHHTQKIDSLRDHGVTLVVVPIKWEAGEVIKGELASAYFSQIDKTIKQAKKNHLWVVLDIDLSFPKYLFDLIGFDLDVIDQQKGYAIKVAQSLFFDGENLAPRLRLEGKPVESFLKKAYAKFLHSITKRYKTFDHILGIKIQHNPGMGLLNNKKLSKIEFNEIVRGESLEKERRIWKDSTPCLWKDQFVWGFEDNNKPKLLLKKYFLASKKRKTDLLHKYYTFMRRAIESAQTNVHFLTEFPDHQMEVQKPYPMTVCGYNHALKFNQEKKRFSYTFRRDERCDEKVMIFLPPSLYSIGFNVSFTSGKCKFDKTSSILSFYPGTTKTHKLVIEPKHP